MLSRERILVKQTVAYDPILVTCHENKQNKTKNKTAPGTCRDQSRLLRELLPVKPGVLP